MFLALLLLGCAPPTCTATCKKVVDECGFGSSVEICVDRCQELQRNPKGHDRPRHDVRDCFAKADCGHILAGDCASYARARYCDGGYFIASSECLDAPAAFHFDQDCRVHTRDDWGALGEPTWEPIGQEGDGSFRYGDCTATDPQATGISQCGECTVALFELL